MVIFPVVTQALNINDVPNPRAINGTWVTDRANILSDRTETQLNQIINKLEAKTGTEIAVVTVFNTESEVSPKAFTTKLFNTWKIGKAARDNGILFLTSVEERRVEIETGYGIVPILSDDRVSQIIQTEIIPHFKTNNFDLGVLQGTKAIVNALQKANNNSPHLGIKQLIDNFQKNKLLKIILGIFISLYYYAVWQDVPTKKETIYLRPCGYTRSSITDRKNNSFSNVWAYFLAYYLMYLSIFFAASLIVIPILNLSKILLIITLIFLNLYSIGKIAQNACSFTDYTGALAYLMLISPIIFSITLVSIKFSSYLGLILIILYFASDKNKYILEKKSFIFLVTNYRKIILSLGLFALGIWTTKKSMSDYSAWMIFWGLETTVPLVYLSWQSYQKRKLSDGSFDAKCYCCEQDLNYISNKKLKDYLKPPEKIAKKLKNVSYQGWHCDNCFPKTTLETNNYDLAVPRLVSDSLSVRRDTIHLMAYTTPYREKCWCKTCEELTMICKSTILKKPTQKSNGSRLNTYTCQCCKLSYKEKKKISRTSYKRSNNSSNYHYGNYGDYGSGSGSSSSDGGGGSFGGGESGGDGAGGSW